ncbi:hypothetical protein [Solidesulfovibrio alcoholivorans]|uniref:hypothetical protein n=1 Tax=Solidesulfovibrio alcoholivorans TaxID=81406 RepID=UPI000495E602|nr:hypothetical protein [Solidesulfovibrio alcoholivorans]
MNMSRAVCRQLLGAGLIHGVTAAALAPDASPEVRQACAKLDRLADHATDYALVGNRRNERGQWVLEPKAQRQRERALQALMREVGRQYEETVDLRDFVTAAMRWIEDLRDQLPVNPVDRRITWADIAGGLQELYDLYDPEREAFDVIDAGGDRGGEFQRCTGVW